MCHNGRRLWGERSHKVMEVEVAGDGESWNCGVMGQGSRKVTKLGGHGERGVVESQEREIMRS